MTPANVKVVMGALVWLAMVSWGGLLESRAWADWLETPKLLGFAAAAEPRARTA